MDAGTSSMGRSNAVGVSIRFLLRKRQYLSSALWLSGITRRRQIAHPPHRGISPFLHLGIAVCMTTNTNVLTQEKSEALLAAGRGNITFSVSDIGADYELEYDLNFEQTRKNILDFFDLKDQKADPHFVTYTSIVEHDLNREKIADMKKFWRAAGADMVLYFAQSNRGGACDNGHYFIGNSKYRQQAIDAMGESGV
jgi:hypothetical protein